MARAPIGHRLAVYRCDHHTPKANSQSKDFWSSYTTAQTLTDSDLALDRPVASFPIYRRGKTAPLKSLELRLALAGGTILSKVRR